MIFPITKDGVEWLPLITSFLRSLLVVAICGMQKEEKRSECQSLIYLAIWVFQRGISAYSNYHTIFVNEYILC